MYMRLYGLFLVLFIGLYILGCKEETVLPVTIMPGDSLIMGDASLGLGDNLESLKATFGEPSVLRDLGELGVYFEYKEFDVSGTLTGISEQDVITNLTLDTKFVGTTSDGIGLGSLESEVVKKLGETSKEPFLGLWWYQESGLALEFQDGQVVRIHLFSKESR